MLNRFGPWLSLFASTGTLFCCALPSLFVALGMGATLAGFVGTFPQVIWLSQYKALVFSLSGGLILSSGALHYYNRNAPCPIDPKLAKACQTSRVWSYWILIFAGSLWLIGAFFAFLAPRIF